MEKVVTAQDAFDHMKKSFNKDKALEIKEKVVMQYNVNGEGGGTWQLVLENGEFQILNGDSIKEVSCTLNYKTLESFVKLRTGELKPMKAFMSGKVKFLGNQSIMQKMAEVFPVGKG